MKVHIPPDVKSIISPYALMLKKQPILKGSDQVTDEGYRDHSQLSCSMCFEDYLSLEHIVVSLDGENFLTPHDQALKELGYSRGVA
ncbi:TPA: hypothetical protein O4H83_002518 [Vibrio cholerae]|uniref:hypothetical protein n=1 Tax=Vibrio TaxID=662 RepID=UPI00111C575C|nr:hypothetical protein [Vibrio cholerae]EGQ8224350.1 hypothetical protein [Vibrio cholerae]MCU4220760.1 hypothetical protein [Vibrio cholerae]HCZ9576137.1 hypothetical protein [Vibrio cholerae]HCZ9601301.1 hypothetical protein [Vibrio cholerae]HCZ9605944.1 hypothetical protein [Vibrio cholerae]